MRPILLCLVAIPTLALPPAAGEPSTRPTQLDLKFFGYHRLRMTDTTIFKDTVSDAFGQLRFSTEEADNNGWLNGKGVFENTKVLGPITISATGAAYGLYVNHRNTVIVATLMVTPHEVATDEETAGVQRTQHALLPPSALSEWCDLAEHVWSEAQIHTPSKTKPEWLFLVAIHDAETLAVIKVDAVDGPVHFPGEYVDLDSNYGYRVLNTPVGRQASAFVANVHGPNNRLVGVIDHINLFSIRRNWGMTLLQSTGTQVEVETTRACIAMHIRWEQEQ